MRHSLITTKKSWFNSPWVTCILIIFLAWGAVSVFNAYKKQRTAVALLSQSRDDMNKLTAQQASLTNQIQSLSTDRGVEAEVRERYRVVKPGEQLVIVVNNSTPSVADPEPTFWQKMRQFIGL